MQDEIACFSKVGSTRTKDYDVCFTSLQKLQLIRQRLLRSLLALESGLEMIRGCMELCEDFGDSSGDPGKDHHHTQAKNYSSKMNGHRRRVLSLLRHIDGSANLVTNLRKTRLVFRRDQAR